MAYTGINKSSLHMNAKLWTGTGSNGNAISGIGFAPDLVWVKNRSGTYDHVLFDRVRGDNKHIESNNTSAEENEAYTLAFGSDGYSVGTNTLNNSGSNIVGWNWKGNGAGSANTEGSVSATVSANTTAGFSIVQYNTAGSGTQTMGHGLNSAPTFIITKPAQNTESWYVYIPTGVSTSLRLNTNAAAVSTTPYSGTPTDTLFSINNGVIGGYTGVISYCFTDVQGYSKFGSYTGNGNVNGPFVYTGFRPEFVILKEASNTNNWRMFDSKRDTPNDVTRILYPSLNSAEGTGDIQVDTLSNGFKNKNNKFSWK